MWSQVSELRPSTQPQLFGAQSELTLSTLACSNLLQCITHSPATHLEDTHKMFATSLTSSLSFSIFLKNHTVWNQRGFLRPYPPLLSSWYSGPETCCNTAKVFSIPPHSQGRQLAWAASASWFNLLQLNHSPELHLERISKSQVSLIPGWNKFPVSP